MGEKVVAVETSTTDTVERGASRGALTINRWLPRRVFDRLVTAILRSPLHGLLGFDGFGMLLTFTGRKSGRRYTLPLAYDREGDTVSTFALFTNTVWWKNLRDGAAVTVRLKGREMRATAEIVENPEEISTELLRWHEKRPRMMRGGYYAVPHGSDGRPDRDKLLEIARTRILIRIRLTDPAPGVATGREFSTFARRLMRTLVAAHVFVFRQTDGRVGGRVGPNPVLLLTTTGRRSGRQSTVALSYLQDGDRYVVVGAVGGAPRNPAWVHNLGADPRVLVQTGNLERQMRAEVAQGAERERLWGRIEAVSSGAFGEMQRKTTRRFPVVVLGQERGLEESVSS